MSITETAQSAKDRVKSIDTKALANKGKKLSSKAISIGFLAYGVSNATGVLLAAPENFKSIVK